VRAAAGFHAHDAFGRERARPDEILGVPLGVDVVRDRGDVVAIAQALSKRIDQRGFAGPDRPSDADAQRTVGALHCDAPSAL